MKLYKYQPDERYEISLSGEGEVRFRFYVADTTLDGLVDFITDFFKDYLVKKSKIVRTTRIEVRKFGEGQPVKKAKTFYGIKAETAYNMLYERISEGLPEPGFSIGNYQCKIEQETGIFRIFKDGNPVACFWDEGLAKWFMEEQRVNEV